MFGRQILEIFLRPINIMYQQQTNQPGSPTNIPVPTVTNTTNVPVPRVVIPIMYTNPIQTTATITPTPTLPTIIPRPNIVVPIIPTTTRPIVPPFQPTIPNVPTIPVQPNIPTIIRQPTVPVVPNVRIPIAPTVPVVVPITTQPNIPIVPTQTTRIPIVPTQPTRIPIVPTQTTRIPVRIPSPVKPIVPRIESPVITTRVPARIPSPAKTTVPTVPTVPTAPRIQSPTRTTAPVLIPSPRANQFPRIVSPQRQPNTPVITTLNPEDLPTNTGGVQIPNIDSPVEIFVDTVIAEQNADIMEEKEYLGYVRYLLNDQSKYNIFSRLFPGSTCPNVTVRMETERSPSPNITPSDNALVRCIHTKETAGGSVAVNFSYQNHANLLWFDTDNKIINRYDPQVAGDEYGQSIMDDTIRTKFELLLPEYIYLGNTLETWQCVQGVRGAGRTFKSDYYCQDYSLLYAINRIRGMSHEEAAFALVARGEDVLIDLAELLRALAYRIRSEMGKNIPERFVAWNPQTQTV